MFTGIVEELGTIATVHRRADTLRVEVRVAPPFDAIAIGGSIAVNGVCLTVVERGPGALAFDVGPETLCSTTLGALRPGARVNLERPLRLGGELGGHLVLGHVDGVGVVERVERGPAAARVRIRLPDRELLPLVIPKGSIAVDGISLTVAEIDDPAIEIMVIPHTLAVTTLGTAADGDRVNLEVDVIGKYLQRSLALRGEPEASRADESEKARSAVNDLRTVT
jgi:riboflavin synthase